MTASIRPAPRLRGEGDLRCMAKLAAVHWATGVAGDFAGRRIGLRVTHAEVLAPMAGALPPRLSPLPPDSVVDAVYSVVTRGSPIRHSVYAGARLLNHGVDLPFLRDDLERYVDVAVALTVRDRVFVHAGVVGFGRRAVLLPGVSGAGKTTLVRALVARGATYYSDDCAVLDEDGRVHAYPREGKNGLSASTVLAALPPLRVGAIVVARYAPNAPAAPPRPVSGGALVLELLRHTTSAQSRASQALRVLAGLARAAPAWAVDRRDAASCAAWIAQTMQREGAAHVGMEA